jgi:hypothetical protein
LNDFGFKGAVPRLTAPYLLNKIGVNVCFRDFSAPKLKDRFGQVSTNQKIHGERTGKIGGTTMASKSA